MFMQEFEEIKIKTSDAEIYLKHGGDGSPLLLLHGYPQTHVMWHKVASKLAMHFHIVCPDLRGYGKSSKPKSSSDHYNYSKRAMAKDMVEVMKFLGHTDFYVAGHDRGARVTHRLALDYPDKIKKACVMDIAPTYHMFKTVDQQFATGYYHWFFLIQPNGLPERMIGADPAYYLTEKLKRWGAEGAHFSSEIIEEYVQSFSDPETIHATCEDYRAAASIDLLHDEEDRNKKVQCPLLVLWGAKGFVHRIYDVLSVWNEYANQVQEQALDCGHYLAEEDPVSVVQELLRFFGGENISDL